MKQLFLLVAIATLFMHCKQEDEQPMSRPLIEIIPGIWTYQNLDFKIFNSAGVLTSDQTDSGGTLEFKSDGTGTVIFSNGDEQPINWSVNSETSVNLNINNSIPLDYDVLLNEENQQHWEANKIVVTGERVEVVIRMSR